MEIKDLNKISTAEKIVLVEQLWDSVSKKDIVVSPEIKSELDFRLQKVKEGKAEYFTWQDVKKHIDTIR
ncbi:putative addiction module component, TIGR02574 family [Flavobacterium micromati]|uniref:Putative addiction module component, TIGR02574 family n=1 Tax=Flavobacterium micromati TaxID=229205 RepID=A0A1M5FPL1_9FLAO|nr:addiction module protein [Flavobacterium micromati]MCL6460698.1 addiction module protein [Flavobacterium micromati]SHF93426.1 putative addiction module component, TIGR02574 family [Flavobacterium micromati]